MLRISSFTSPSHVTITRPLGNGWISSSWAQEPGSGSSPPLGSWVLCLEAISQIPAEIGGRRALLGKGCWRAALFSTLTETYLQFSPDAPPLPGKSAPRQALGDYQNNQAWGTLSQANRTESLLGD
ncbi:unnamed protein product [Caretta caretta]